MDTMMRAPGPDAALVRVAQFTSRVEALTVAARLDAAGMLLYLGAEHAGGALVYPLALGGYPIHVPIDQQADAQALLDEIAVDAPVGSAGLRRAVLRLFYAWVGAATMVFGGTALLTGLSPIGPLLAAPFAFLSFPVPAQARGVYKLTG